MGLRECYIILVLCASVYAGVVPESPFEIGHDEEIPSTTFINSKDILHGFEDDGANSVDEDLNGVPAEAQPDNSVTLNPFPSYPANNVETTPEPQTPITTTSHHPFFFGPRHPILFPKLKEALREIFQENQVAFRKKVQAFVVALKSLQEAGKTMVDSILTIGNTIPRFTSKFQDKMNEARKTKKQ